MTEIKTTPQPKDGNYGFTNPGFIVRSREAYRSGILEEAKSSTDTISTKMWLEQQLHRNSREIEVFNRTFKFKPVGTNIVSETVRRASTADSDDLGDTPQLLDDICEILGEHCLDDDMGPEEFGQIPPKIIQSVFRELATGDLDNDEVNQITDFQ